MYLSDFVFFSVTLSLLALMAIVSGWDHISHYTDWEQKVHVIATGKLNTPDIVQTPHAPALRAPEPKVALCDCKNWATWNNEGIETPTCCRTDTVAALKSLVSVLDESNIKYSLEGGTLLGAVRCGEFIQYDYDVDITVESPEPFLVKAALDKWHRHDTDNIFDRMTVHLTGLPWPQTEIEGSYQSHVMVDIHIVDRLSKTRPCLFEGVMMRCVGDYHSRLTKKYGKDWMIPHRWTNSRKEGLNQAIDMKQLNHCVEKRETMSHLCAEFPNVIVGEKGCTLKNNIIKSKYEYKAQAGQDKYVEQFLNHENGVYVEFGARDGIEHSNTYYFEKTYNWTGILVEPDDRELKKITKNRPNAHIYTGVAVCPVGTKEVSFAISSNRGWSGIHNSYDDKRWHNTVISQKKMPCVDLNEICPEHVDYMTVDTEGSEVEILRTFDFTSHDVTIIQVERNMKTRVQQNEEKQLTQFMSRKGYEKIKQIDIGNWAVDCIYKKII
jgi:hypothetical protein